MSRTIILPLLWFMIRNKISVIKKLHALVIIITRLKGTALHLNFDSHLLSLSKVQELQGIFSNKFWTSEIFHSCQYYYIAIISSRNLKLI